MNAAHQIDGYKIGHPQQYPNGTERIYSNFTARSGKLSSIPNSKGVYLIGTQLFILDYLINEWNSTFFNKSAQEVVNIYKRRVSNILGYDVNVDHILDLHSLGFLPIEIKALPEGSFVPYGIPMLTLSNTIKRFYWVTNMVETVLSSELWQPITSATTFMGFKELFLLYARKTGVDEEFVAYQGHDFSMRGMAGRKAAAASSFAILAAGCKGTDCVPAIDIAEEYYGADSDLQEIGSTVNATEHSVMCAGGESSEKETFIRLLTEVYPIGILSVVSDTWDFWKVITVLLPEIKDIILERDGKLVIRPDSGDPFKIICGDISAPIGSPEHKGLIQLLWEIFGGTWNKLNYKVLNEKIGAIYGDGITYQIANDILANLSSKGFASSNIIFGLGSYTYQYVTRDTHGMAFKSTYSDINGVGSPIFKDPKTDTGLKKSAKGLLMVSKSDTGFKLNEEVDSKSEKRGCLQTVFKNGKALNLTTLSAIRELTNEQI